MRISCLTIASFLVGVVGCGGGGSTGVSNQAACMADATAYCAKLDACRTKGVALRFGDMNTCVTRRTLSCTNSLAANGTGNTAAHTQACATALAGASCDDFFAGTIAACAAPVGKLANGAACTFSGQCASAWCATAVGAQCGTCAMPPASGGACVNGECPPGTACVNNACAPLGATGATCTGAADCQASMECVGASSTTAGTCQPGAMMAGGMCDRKAGPPCDYNLGLVCISPAMMTAGTCQSYMYTAGAGCGFNAMASTQTLCTGGALCVGASKGVPGNCVAPAADGAACDTKAGPPCLSPARCVLTSPGGTAGTCMPPDASKCM